MLSVLFLEDVALVADAASSIGPALAGRLRSWTATANAAGATVFQGAEAIDQVADDWQALENAGGSATPFQSLAMARAAAEIHLKAGEIPRVAVVRHGGRPVVILPTVIGTRFGVKVARFLGDPLIQYGDALCEPGTAKRHIEAAFHAAADPSAIDALHLRKVRGDARIAPVLRQHAIAFNGDEAPFLDIAGPQAHEEPRQVRRARRKLSALGPLRLTVTQGAAARDHLREALTLKRRWLEARRLPSSVVGCEHWESAIDRLADHDGDMQLNLAVLHVSDRPAAYEVAFTAGDRWYAFIGAVADEFARHSPGRVQVADTIAWCRDNGFARYDLLAPADDVKRSYCRDAAPVSDYSHAVRPAGHALTAALRLTPVAKAVLVRLPAPLRRLALSVAGR
ncbi:GNAT family N-acetyltransferase [Undibacter mobilis]|uniref:GNAT family N-acetyltransferase n=1 Tax=Undibacter mobilis TaxID=2292256 RepID=A0A371BC74_9BRAD|nr:GNAT family N-acetyltransferase [Undibacter mobilis]RDV05160.1 GNAT family N-acetyltransferase [Undibacter mobilis]